MEDAAQTDLMFIVEQHVLTDLIGMPKEKQAKHTQAYRDYLLSRKTTILCVKCNLRHTRCLTCDRCTVCNPDTPCKPVMMPKVGYVYKCGVGAAVLAKRIKE